MTRGRQPRMLPAALSAAAVVAMTGCAPTADGDHRRAGAERPSRANVEKRTVQGLGLEMVRIPAGSFVMGSPADEPARRDDESQHGVTISRPFYMGAYEVTQGEYYKLMLPDFEHESWTYKRGPLHAGGAFCYRRYTGGLIFRGSSTGGELNLRHPMESVTWDDAVAFCRKLTETERAAGRLPEGHVYRLPTEAEWEYACRAGTSGRFNVGAAGLPSRERLGQLAARPRGPGGSARAALTGADADAGYDKLKEFAFVGGGWTSPVGEGRRPNAWGLHDMHGNVYEWCLDRYGPYPTREVTDPTGPDKGILRVARGGCFIGCDPAKENPEALVYPFIRSASRYGFRPDVEGYAILGFRVVLAPRLE